MTLRFLVVDDLGNARAGNFALGVAGRAEVEIIQNVQELVDGSKSPGWLAEFDACFVDFDLASHKMPGYGTSDWGRLTLESGTGQTRTVQVDSGMSALLWIRSTTETQTYQEARAKVLTLERKAWSEPTGALSVHTFVQPNDWISRLYAAAASAWFGTRNLNAQATPAQFRDLTKSRASLSMSTPNPEIAASGKVLDAWLRSIPKADTEYFKKGKHPTAFDWCRIYYRLNPKKAKWTQQGLQDAVHAVCARQVVKKVNQQQFGWLCTDLANGAQEVRRPFFPELKPEARWADWKQSERDIDPLYDFLHETQKFWETPDVHAAFVEHGRRNPGLL